MRKGSPSAQVVRRQRTQEQLGGEFLLLWTDELRRPELCILTDGGSMNVLK